LDYSIKLKTRSKLASRKNPVNLIFVFLWKHYEMKKIVPFAILFFTFFQAQSQRKNEWQAQKVGTVDPSKITEDWFVHLQNLESPSPDGNSFRAELQRRKLLIDQLYPRKNKTSISNRIASSQPISGRMMEGNLAGNGTPNDNTLAISNGGILVSAINSNLFFYDVENDTLLGINSLTQFATAGGVKTTNSKYDPKVI
jgi:hypothetical protein